MTNRRRGPATSERNNGAPAELQSSASLEQLNAILRADFPSFVQKCFHTLLPTQPFLNNWHILAMAHHLEQVRRGNIRRLIITLPPRTLKSIVGSVAFPAFLLGHNPSARLITVSYSADLATKHANDFRIVMSSDWYRHAFPHTRISERKNTEAEVTTTRHGYRVSTSVGGTLTGRGAQTIIIDDALKPEDALSDSKRERVNDWYINTLLSRLDDKSSGAIILIMQRLHTDDLAGFLLRSSNQWTLLNLPAVTEAYQEIPIGENRLHAWRAGELLHPDALSAALLESYRKEMGADAFAAQFLQNPIPPGGAMIKRDWVRRYEALPPRTPSTYILQSWDTASKDGGKNDYSVCSTWLVQDQRYYLVDIFRGRLNYPALKAAAIAHAKLHKPTTILIEDSEVGTALIAELQATRLSVVAVKPEHSKVTRMSVQSGKFESGRVFFPRSASWLETLEMELFAFPGLRHDDQIDSISQALCHKISAAGWDARSLENFAKFADALAMDAYLGRVTGRPW
jgi:predicted phage terminase large subunit-like protein